MDFSDPTSLISGLLLGLLGTALLVYGKKQQEFLPAAAGIAVCADSYFVSSVALSWLVAGVCLAGLYLISRNS